MSKQIRLRDASLEYNVDIETYTIISILRTGERGWPQLYILS